MMLRPTRNLIPKLVALAAFVGGVHQMGAEQTTQTAPVVTSPSTATVAANTLSAGDGAYDRDTPHTAAGDKLLEEADKHFNLGRQFYFAGNLAGAKREFDSAVDVLLSAPDSLPDERRVSERLNEMCDLIYRFDIEKLGAGQKDEEASAAFDQAPIDEVSHTTFPVDPALAPKLKAEVNGTSSGIPLELSEPVLSYVHFFSTDRGRGILLSGFKRGGRYRSLIERIFTEQGVPQELIYLAQAESGFLPRAVSRKSAVGMWQFIAETGSTYDLVRTSAFDERLDPEKATRAAAKFLKNLYARYGDWYLAMAAYNCGAGAVDHAIERTGYADYWELLKRHALPRETSNYVPIIVAIAIMAKNPMDYGLDHIDVDAPLQTEAIQLTASTNLDLIADATMQPVSVIHDLNPSLLKSVAPAGFRIYVPAGTALSTQAALETVPSANRNAWRLHHVERGDTIEAIARSYHTPAVRIAAVNRSSSSLAAGDVLLIPAAFHEERQPIKRAYRLSSSRSRSRTAAGRSHRAGIRSAHVAASRHIAVSALSHSSVLHSAAAIR